jgi:hypothetical protein
MLSSFSLQAAADPSTYDMKTLIIPAIGFGSTFLAFPVLLILGFLHFPSMLAYLVTLGLQVGSPFADTYLSSYMTGTNTYLASAVYAWTMPWYIKEELATEITTYFSTLSSTVVDAIIYGAFGATVFFEVLAIYLPIFKHNFLLWLLVGPFYLINMIGKNILWMAGVLIVEDVLQTAYTADSSTFYLGDTDFTII